VFTSQLLADCDRLLKLATACDAALKKFDAGLDDFYDWLTETEGKLRELQAVPSNNNTNYPQVTSQAKVSMSVTVCNCGHTCSGVYVNRFKIISIISVIYILHVATLSGVNTKMIFRAYSI
jgi:hypothetical protein